MIPLLTVSILVFNFFLLSSSSQISISVTPNTLSKSGDHVTIQWTGIPSPSKLDWLGIYSPPNSLHDNFIGYIFLSSTPEWESGSGSISIPLVNLRSGYQFRIFRWTETEVVPELVDHDHNPLPQTKHLLVESEEIGFGSGRGPEQVHLALTGREDEMRVMFVTPDGKESYVRYGLTRKRLGWVVRTRVLRYEREDMCDAPANSSSGWRDSGYIHDGVVLNLKKGKKYYYQVGSDSGGWSTIYSFVSQNGDSGETFAFLFGDMGTATPYLTFLRTQEESTSTIKWISRDIEALGNKPALISHIGDISYARGYSWLWDNFFTQIEPIASRVPYHVCIGNHEYDWPLQPWKPEWSSYGKDGGGECGVPYSHKFHMPGNSSEPTGNHAPATRNLYYSFDSGPVHFVYMSTETNFLPGHRPMYTTSSGKKDVPLRKRMIEYLEPLLVKNNVNLVLWGHVHRYERFCPLSNFTCGSLVLNGEKWKTFPVQVVIGMAGQDWQPIWAPREDHPSDPIYPQPLQSLYRGSEFGYMRLHATKEKLILSYVGNHDGEVHDMVEILASGQVLSDGIHDGPAAADQMESKFSWYVKVGSVLMLGAFIGYIVGFISHARKNAADRGWRPVKTEEI
ncbi:unnamed protein product [Withania somnifera]